MAIRCSCRDVDVAASSGRAVAANRNDDEDVNFDDDDAVLTKLKPSLQWDVDYATGPLLRQSCELLRRH